MLHDHRRHQLYGHFFSNGHLRAVTGHGLVDNMFARGKELSPENEGFIAGALERWTQPDISLSSSNVRGMLSDVLLRDYHDPPRLALEMGLLFGGYLSPAHAVLSEDNLHPNMVVGLQVYFATTHGFADARRDIPTHKEAFRFMCKGAHGHEMDATHPSYGLGVRVYIEDTLRLLKEWAPHFPFPEKFSDYVRVSTRAGLLTEMKAWRDNLLPGESRTNFSPDSQPGSIWLATVGPSEEYNHHEY